MRLLGPIVGILRTIMKNIRRQFPMSYTIAAQLIRHDLSWFTAMTA
jgi:hypothetical protein